MQGRIPAIYMRGGTSKGVFFHEKDIPEDPRVRDEIILAAYGSPDPNGRQVDGIGGATSTTSKVAIIGSSENPEYDVVYTFGQVSIDRAFIDYKGNCGNISAAVGPFAIDEGLVKPTLPVTEVRILQKNTGKLIIAEVPVKDGLFDEEGDCAIDGVPGTGSKINLRFCNPGGSVTGKLFPTGNLIDTLHVEGVGEIRVTIMDASNPVVFVDSRDLGLMGTEIQEIEAKDKVRGQLEGIRGAAAVKMGLASTPEKATQFSQAIPKIAMVAPPQSYRALSGKIIEEGSIDLVGRIMSMGTLNKAYAVSGAICTVGAAMIKGTVVHEMLEPRSLWKGMLCLGHPSGVIEVGARIERNEQDIVYSEAAVTRTARRLMEGTLLVPRKLFHGETGAEKPHVSRDVAKTPESDAKPSGG